MDDRLEQRLGRIEQRIGQVEASVTLLRETVRGNRAAIDALAAGSARPRTVGRASVAQR